MIPRRLRRGYKKPLPRFMFKSDTPLTIEQVDALRENFKRAGMGRAIVYYGGDIQAVPR